MDELRSVRTVLEKVIGKNTTEQEMKGKNYEICHDCRQAGHWLGDCPTKTTCPVCGEGLVRLFEVEKPSSKYLEKLFYSCSRPVCRFFVWEDEVSSCRAKVKTLVEEETDQLSHLLKTCARISNEEKVDVTVVNFRPSEHSRTDKGKEKVEE